MPARKKIISATAKFIGRGVQKARKALASEFVSQSEAAIKRTAITPPKVKKGGSEFLEINFPPDWDMPESKAEMLSVLKTKNLSSALDFVKEFEHGGRAVYNPKTKTYFVWDSGKKMHATGKKALRAAKHDIGPGWDLNLEKGETVESVKEQLRISKENAKLLDDEGIIKLSPYKKDPYNE